MKKILFLFLAACFFFSCEKETIVIPQQHAGRTVLAFFWADNSLNSSLRDNIQTMMQGLQAMKDSAALLVYWDGEASDISWPEPCIVEYVTNGQGGINSLSKGTIDAMMADKNTSIYDLIGIGNIRKKYPPQTSTEKTVMQTVIGDMMSAYPSESYGIIFGSHGSGWLPTITGTRSIGQDGGRYSSDTALIPELAEVLRTVNPQKFDFVLFDACMMGCAEVYYELKDAARYCIASVLDIPAAGFPYASVMPYLYENAIKDYLEPICKDYIDYYNYIGWGTISAVDCILKRGTYTNNLQTKRHSALTRFIKYSGIIIVYHELRIVRLHYILKYFLIVGCSQIINSVCDCYSSFNSLRVIMGYYSRFLCLHQNLIQVVISPCNRGNTHCRAIAEAVIWLWVV